MFMPVPNRTMNKHYRRAWSHISQSMQLYMVQDMFEPSQSHSNHKRLCQVTTSGKRASAALSWRGITLSKCSPQGHEPTDPTSVAHVKVPNVL